MFIQTRSPRAASPRHPDRLEPRRAALAPRRHVERDEPVALPVDRDVRPADVPRLRDPVQPPRERVRPDRRARRRVQPGELRSARRVEGALHRRDPLRAGQPGRDAAPARARARVDPVQRVAEAERPQGVVAELEPADGARRVGHDEPAAAGGVEPHCADPGDRPDVVTRRPDVAHPERPTVGCAHRRAGDDAVRLRVDPLDQGQLVDGRPELIADGGDPEPVAGPDADRGLHRPGRGIEAQDPARDVVGDPDRAERIDDLHGVVGHVQRRHDARLGRQRRRVAAQPEGRGGHGGDDHRERDRAGEHGGDPALAAQGPRGRAAPHVALGRLLQLQPEPGHEVVAHVPILRRTAASPRLTRLRTTDSEVASESAISS